MKNIYANYKYNYNYKYNVVGKSESDDEAGKYVFEKQLVDTVEVNPNATLNSNMEGTPKILQALYNGDTKKITKLATQEKCAKENLICWLAQLLLQW